MAAPLQPLRRRIVHEKPDPMQCLFCACDISLLPENWKKIRESRNQLWNHVEVTMHCTKLEAYSFGEKKCGTCEKGECHLFL